MVRIGIGFAASLVGFVCASWFYGTVGAMLEPYVTSRSVANILGFLIVFTAVLTLGALISMVMAKLFKIVGLSWLDRLGGAAFGFVRGVLVSVVILMAMVAFAPSRVQAAVTQSTISPYVLEASKVLAVVTPFELKDGFHRSYEEIRKFWNEGTKKKARKVPTEHT
jgi:membrane protein required for colicin V production